MTLMQGYLIGAAYMGVLMASCGDEVPRGTHMFAAAVIVMAMWPLAPVFILVERRFRKRGSL